MDEKIKQYAICIICGTIISLASGLYAQDLTKGLGASITGYGLPLPWLEKTVIIVPDSPTHYSLPWYGLTLLVNIVFWSTLVRITYALYKRSKAS